MKIPVQVILTINGGSSSIKFALFEVGGGFRRILEGSMEQIGQPGATLRVSGLTPAESFSRVVATNDQDAAAEVLLDWVSAGCGLGRLTAAGHRVVHGGPKYYKPQRITDSMIEDLHGLRSLDPEHLPVEILLIEALRRKVPLLPQVACFDTAFHRDLPRVARMIPIPRRYEALGVRKYGFHGLSCEYLMRELDRVAGTVSARGRVILAHLGSGVSLTAVRDGASLDTTMSLSPVSGVPMSTRSGDLDPGLFWYLAGMEHIDPERFRKMVTFESGLLGISETSSDMRELLFREVRDSRSGEAIDMFCYGIRKAIGALTAVLGGLDTLVFAGGIGENAPAIRARICDGLGFLGIELDPKTNAAGAGVISAGSSRAAVRVIHTNEEWVIARSVCGVLGFELIPDDGNARRHSDGIDLPARSGGSRG